MTPGVDGGVQTGEKIDIKQLKCLIVPDQMHYFGRTAAVCHITQPVLFMRIRNLEEELSLTLVQRGQRLKGSTSEGERILTWARAVLAAHDGLAAEAAICHEQMAGQLWVGMVPLVNLNPMQLTKPLAEEYPALQFSLLSMTLEQIIDGVSRNQLDLGICYLRHLNQCLSKVARLPQTRMGLLYDKRHSDLSDGTSGWEALATLPFGLLVKGMYYRESVETSFRVKGLTPKYVFENDSTFQIIQAVQAGICCAIIPLDSGLEALGDNPEILPVAGTQTNPQLALIMRRQESVSTPVEKYFAEAQGIFG